MQWNGMTIDWSVVKEWGLQVPAMGMLFAGGCVALGAIIWIVFYTSRVNRTLATDFREAVTNITKDSQEHQREMRRLAAEDSKSLQEILEETNRTIGRANQRLDYHDTRQKEHEELMRIYRDQVRTASST